jgi:hypothetical protein
VFTFAACAVIEDLLGSRARARPLPVPDLRPAARRLRGRLAAAWAAGRAALRAAAGVAALGAAAAVLLGPPLWQIIR